MSNSSLVTYTKLSPNNSGKRKHKIDTISIHCTAGNINNTAIQIANNKAFVEYSIKNASCNYAIGGDGSVALIVDESNRSWCTSSSANDNRAITIEVASSNISPYKVTDTAYNKLIDLLVDICKRNNIKKLLWKADKNLIGQVDKQNLTVHRWFANKSCPGDYLYKLHYDIAEKVNKKLAGNEELSYEEVLKKSTNQWKQWEECIDAMIALGTKTDTFYILKSTKTLIVKLYSTSINVSNKSDYDKILKEVTTSYAEWHKSIEAIVAAAEADGDLGTLETVKFFKQLIVKIYGVNH